VEPPSYQAASRPWLQSVAVGSNWTGSWLIIPGGGARRHHQRTRSAWLPAGQSCDSEPAALCSMLCGLYSALSHQVAPQHTNFMLVWSYLQVRWYSFQFIMAQLVDELSDMHNAMVRARILPRCMQKPCVSPCNCIPP